MIRGVNRITASLGDIQNIIAKAVEKVIAILMMLVLASDMMSSNCATSADSTDIRFPVCLVSK